MPHVYILGISAFYHDSAACLLRDGELVAAAQEERFSRKKHDEGFPGHAIQYCLKEAGIAPHQLTHVAFYDKPWLKFERLLETYLAFAPAGLGSFLKAMPQWLTKKLWIGDAIRKELEFQGPLYFPEHHQSHAASAFYPSPFQRAAVLTIDGVGEWATASWGQGDGKTLTLAAELRFPHSLGLLYSAFTYYTGFKVNSGEYKVMGLAPYGKPLYAQLILDELMDLKADGSFRLNLKYFNYCQGLTMTSEAFHQLFGGPPRQPESELTQRDMDLARSIQDVTEQVMVRMAAHVRRATGERNLCLAGGVALNCVGNGAIVRKQLFDRVWIQPAAGDAGGALGACYFTWHEVLQQPRTASDTHDAQRGSFLGPAFDADAVASWANAESLPYRNLNGSAPEVAAELIASGKVVGWFNGRMEFGPRALGARSILGDARNPTMQSAMNLKIKFRESFRPFAPSCLEEDAGDYFELDCPSPYMLLVAPVRSERRQPETGDDQRLFGIARVNRPRSDVPAITHVDYSARVHTVNKDDHAAYRRLIEAFKAQTGSAVVINTSFNVRGEPIVCTPQDAYRCFMRTTIDALFIEDLLFLKSDQPALRDDENWKERFQLD